MGKPGNGPEDEATNQAACLGYALTKGADIYANMDYAKYCQHIQDLHKVNGLPVPKLPNNTEVIDVRKHGYSEAKERMQFIKKNWSSDV